MSDNWISIDQQLPDDDIDVLVYVPELDLVCTGHMDSGDWYADNGAKIDVTHWMHLPGPPAD